jgi:hypothetical protein
MVNCGRSRVGLRLADWPMSAQRELHAADNTADQLQFSSRAVSSMMMIVLVNMLVLVKDVLKDGTLQER